MCRASCPAGRVDLVNRGHGIVCRHGGQVRQQAGPDVALNVVGGRFAHIPVAVGEDLREPPLRRLVLGGRLGLRVRRLSLRRQVQEQLAGSHAVLALAVDCRPRAKHVVPPGTQSGGVRVNNGGVTAEVVDVGLGEDHDLRWAGQLADVAPFAVTAGRVARPRSAHAALPEQRELVGAVQHCVAVPQGLRRGQVVLRARLRELRRACPCRWCAARWCGRGRLGRRIPGRAAEVAVGATLFPAEDGRGERRWRSAYGAAGRGSGHGRPRGGHAAILLRAANGQSGHTSG